MSPSHALWRDASELFAAVRDAAFDLDSIALKLATLRARTDLHAMRYDVPHVRGGSHDAMGASDVYIEQEQRLERRRTEDRDLVSLACDIIYGSDDALSGGVAALMGIEYADALWWRFVAHAGWKETAEGVGRSERWCREAVDAAFALIDSYGWERVVEGIGLAEG